MRASVEIAGGIAGTSVIAIDTDLPLSNASLGRWGAWSPRVEGPCCPGLRPKINRPDLPAAGPWSTDRIRRRSQWVSATLRRDEEVGMAARPSRTLHS